MDECGGCLVCDIKETLEELKEAGAGADDVIPMLMELVGDVFGVITQVDKIPIEEYEGFVESLEKEVVH